MGTPFQPGVAQELLFTSYHGFFMLRGSSFFIMAEEGAEKPLVCRAMEVAMFGHEIGDQRDIAEASQGFTPTSSPLQGFKFDLMFSELYLMPISSVLKEKTTMIALGEKLDKLELATGYKENKLVGLFNQLVSIKGYPEKGWLNHLVVITLSNEANASLTSLLSKYIKDPVKLFTAVAKVLGNSPNVLSAEIPVRVAKIAQLVKDKGPTAVEEFKNMSLEEAVNYLENGDPELSKEFKSFLEKFGHRCYNEFELAEKSWQENKGAIIDMVKKNCFQDDDIDSSKRKKKLTVDEVVNSLELELSFKDELLLKKIIIPRCQTRVAMREITKDIIIDHIDKERKATRLLAKELRKNLRIPDEDLFYYFFYDEIEPLIREAQPMLVAQAKRRRNMFKIFNEPWTFDEIIRTWDMVPTHLRASKELDKETANLPKLYGTPASGGRVQAKVCLIKGYSNIDKMRAGEILCTHSTDTAWSPIYNLASGYITEVGGLLSHAAVIAREYGLPSVIGIPDVTRILEDGEEVILDADKGSIVRLSKSPLK